MTWPLRYARLGGIVAFLLGLFSATPVPNIHANTSVPQVPSSFVGVYPLQEFTLELNGDGAVVLTQAPQELGGNHSMWSGTWRMQGEAAIVRIIQGPGGAKLNPAPEIRFDFLEGFPRITGGVVAGVTTNLEALTFTLGTGERHPLVRKVNRQLSQYGFLNYRYPERNDDLYNESVRNAVTRFQESQHLSPTGAVDAKTWEALLKPILAVPVAPPTAHAQAATTNVYIRSGPSTSSASLSKIQTGVVMDVVGKIVGATPETTWWQVCCVDGQKGWIRGDLVAITGPTAVVPIVAAPVSPTSTPPAKQTATRPGKPLLDNLPSHTADGSPIAYLTFDDGPSSFTPKFLEVLSRYHAHGTFFMIGESAKGHADIVRAVAKAGHYVANHTYTHINLQNISHEKFIEESELTRQTLLSEAKDVFTLDGDVRFLRPPYGATDSHTRGYAAEEGYQVVLWDVDPMDWRRPGAEAISSHIIRNAFPGSVVLMHDGGGERSQTLEALGTVLAELSARGFKFYNILAQ